MIMMYVVYRLEGTVVLVYVPYTYRQLARLGWPSRICLTHTTTCIQLKQQQQKNGRDQESTKRTQSSTSIMGNTQPKNKTGKKVVVQKLEHAKKTGVLSLAEHKLESCPTQVFSVRLSPTLVYHGE